MIRGMRPRPRVTGKPSPAVMGKGGASPVGNASRTAPRQMLGTRSQAAAKLINKKGF